MSLIDQTEPDPAGAFVVGPELLDAGRPAGPIAGLRFAAKEVFDVAGLPTGAGNPDRRADRAAAIEHAWIVNTLLSAGADLMGTTITDELAFSLSGTNVHDGTPRHPIDPERVPGGSSAGSASAVAHGLVDIGIGTDTGGSIRVPASYCGIVGLRPTHGRVPVDGVTPLAPAFDTVGLLARDVATLAAVWAAVDAALPSEEVEEVVPTELLVATDLFDLLDPVGDLRRQLEQAVETVAAAHGLPVGSARLADVTGLGSAELLDAFRALQMAEIWQTHGAWITDRQPDLGPGIRARFAAASAVTTAEVDAARPVRDRCRSALRSLTGGGTIVVQPSASGVAPLIDQDMEAKNDMRRRTLELTTPAGLAGLPALSVPAAMIDGLPVGLAFVGAAAGESALIGLAAPLDTR